MTERLDLRTRKEMWISRMKKGLILFPLAILILLFGSGCMNMGRFADMADDRVNGIEGLMDVGEDAADEYENFRELRQKYSYFTHLGQFVNRTCSSYIGKDESGGEFTLEPWDIKNVLLRSSIRGDEDVSFLLFRVDKGDEDCAGDAEYSDEVDESGEITIR